MSDFTNTRFIFDSLGMERISVLRSTAATNIGKLITHTSNALKSMSQTPPKRKPGFDAWLQHVLFDSPKSGWVWAKSDLKSSIYYFECDLKKLDKFRTGLLLKPIQLSLTDETIHLLHKYSDEKLLAEQYRLIDETVNKYLE